MVFLINNITFQEACVIFIQDSWFNIDNRLKKERFISISIIDNNFTITKEVSSNLDYISIGNGTKLSSNKLNRSKKSTQNKIYTNLENYLMEPTTTKLLNISLEFLFSIVSNVSIFQNFKLLYLRHNTIPNKRLDDRKLSFLSHWAYLIDNLWAQYNDDVALLTITKYPITLDNPPDEIKYNLVYSITQKNYIEMDQDRSKSYKKTIDMYQPNLYYKLLPKINLPNSTLLTIGDIKNPITNHLNYMDQQIETITQSLKNNKKPIV